MRLLSAPVLDAAAATSICSSPERRVFSALPGFSQGMGADRTSARSFWRRQALPPANLLRPT